MDWRHNQWIGVVAAVAVVIGIVGVFLYLTRMDTPRDFGGVTFLCESTQQTFNVSDRDLDTAQGLADYGDIAKVSDFKCRLSDKNDAVRVYWCAECQKWYPYTRAQATAESIRCPAGHQT